jgi:hypothetical protein
MLDGQIKYCYTLWKCKLFDFVELTFIIKMLGTIGSMMGLYQLIGPAIHKVEAFRIKKRNAPERQHLLSPNIQL